MVVFVSTENKTTVFYLDSLNKKNVVKEVGVTIAKFLRDVGAPSVEAKAIKTPRQLNENYCGLHVVSHFNMIVRAIDRHSDDELVEVIETASFRSIIKRSEFSSGIEDAIVGLLYRSAYWGLCSSENSTMWWPCRRVSPRLASRLDTSSTSASQKIPVIWFKKVKGDTMWIHPAEIKPLVNLTLDQVIEQSELVQGELELLREAYAQPKQ